MTEILLISRVFTVLITIFGFWLAFWVLFSDKKTKINQMFFLITILIILWNIFAHLGLSTIEIEKSIFWYRLNFGVVSLFFLTTYYFTQYFPQEKKRSNLLNYFIIITTSLFFIISTFTDLIIKDVEIKEWGAGVIFGDLGGIIGFKGFSLLLMIIILTYFIKKYYYLSIKEKIKSQYFLIGMLIFALFNIIFNIIFPLILLETTKYQHFGDFSAIFFLSFTAYAIVKHQLFEIKIVLTSLLVGLIAILLTLDLFIFTPQPWLQILKGIALIIFLFFGYFLIKSVIQEIEQKEKLQKLTLELEKTNINFQKANIELRKLDKTKSEFISITSHQLRTPLTVIKGYISMILNKDYGKPPEEMQKPLENIYNSNERLIKLVNDILGISRIEAGKTELNFKKTSLEEIIISIVEELKNEAEKKNIYLRFEKPLKNLPKILIDEDKIRQAIFNIVDNAIKYTHQGGITIEIKGEGSKYIIEIKDTGEGMSEEEASSLFQSFSRGSAGKKSWVAGSGLGLYIAKKLVEMHCGEIWAESLGKNKGSTFYIKLRSFKNPHFLKNR